MALIKLGGGVTDIRGSMGGTTFSRCAGGNYMRARTKPVNPRSPLQNARRAQVAHLTTYWSKTITEQERTDWRAYAQATSWTNKLGESITINGLAAFLRVNALRHLAGLAIVEAAPLASGHAGGVAYTFLAESDTTNISVVEPTSGFDKDTDDHVLYLFMGIPAEAGKISIPKGFKFIGAIEGDSGAAPAFPNDIAAAYTMQIGQFVTIRAMFQDENFRVSGPFWSNVLAAAAV